MNTEVTHIHKHILCAFYIFCGISIKLLFSINIGQSQSHWTGTTGKKVSSVAGLIALCKLHSTHFPLNTNNITLYLLHEGFYVFLIDENLS